MKDREEEPVDIWRKLVWIASTNLLQLFCAQAKLKELRAMKSASVAEIKQELKRRNVSELVELCLRLSRFKKENKELLTYLLFEADELPAYIRQVNEEIDEGIRQVNTSSLYLAKKTIRKVLRIANKHIRYTGSKTAETEILLHYLIAFRALPVNWKKSAALHNLYLGQLKKLKAAIATLHEDLQYDYLRQVDRLE